MPAHSRSLHPSLARLSRAERRGHLSGQVLKRGAFALLLAATAAAACVERRRRGVAEDALEAQAGFLESLAGSIAAVSSRREPDEILAALREEACRLFDAADARFLPSGEAPAEEAKVVAGGMRLPLAVSRDEHVVLALERSKPFHPFDLVRAAVLVDFASRAVENVRLLAEAREREAERERLTESLITAEQDERRRLSLFLHDGPLQSMSGIALMHDAALATLEEGRYEEAAKLIASTLERERATIGSLRNLSFEIEPVVLRDEGFAAAVQALGDQIEHTHRITVSADVRAAERLAEKAQIALYQFIRESANHAVRRRPQRIDISVFPRENGDFAIEVADDGMGERRRASIDEIDERVRVLNARLEVDQRAGGGTAVRAVLPKAVAALARTAQTN